MSPSPLTPSLPLLTTLFDTSPYGVIAYQGIRDIHGRIVDYKTRFYNQQVLTITGHTAEQMTQQTLFERAPYLREHAEDLGRVVDQLIPYEVDELIPSNNRWFLFDNRPLEDGFFTTFIDIDDNKRAQQQLNQQQQLLHGIIHATDNFIAYCETVRDHTGEIIDFVYRLTNRFLTQRPDIEADQLIGHRMTTYFPGVKQTGLFQRFAEVVRTGQPESFEFQYKADGYNAWYLISTAPLREGIVLSFKNISALKQTSLLLQQQKELFDGVLDNITNGLSVLEAVRDESGVIIDVCYVRVSQAILNHTGLRADQLLGKTMASVFPGVKDTPYWTAFLRAFETGEPQHFEVNYAFDGFDNYTDNWVTRLDENRIISVYSIINEQKQAEAQARQQAALLQTVLDSCQTPIALFEAIRNASGQIIDFRYLLQNDTNARLVGLPNARATDRTMLEVLPILKSSGIFDTYVQVVETGQSKRLEHHFTDSPFNGWYAISAVKQEDGIVVTANDLTLLHETLQRAEQLVNDLKQSNRSLEQFAYIASHDMQEPLRKIQSFGNLLLDYYSSSIPEDGQSMLRRMQSAADRMSQLIRDLLAYSRLSIDVELSKPVSLNQIFLEIKSDLEIIIREKDAQITLGDGSANSLPTLAGNASQLRQLFQNLLSNALKFVSPGTTPVVSVQARGVNQYDLPPTLVNRARRSWVAIDITDNGIGFDEKYQEQIFQLFERLHGRNEYMGTGIGLAVCRKVAENHGGTITVRSKPGQGTTFTVYLPEREYAKD